MSCNGRGHGWNCNCGFGSEQDALRVREPPRVQDLFVPKIPRHYTKTNDRCSFCDAPVFFRALQHGGRAYFDNPGAPWSKHPCLDQDSSTFLGTVDDSDLNWPQLFEPRARHAGGGFLALRGRLRGVDWTGYLKAQHLRRICLDVACLRECFIQVRESSPGVFDLALLTEDLRKYVAEAFATKTAEATPRPATPRKKTGRGKSKAVPLDQPDLLTEVD